MQEYLLLSVKRALCAFEDDASITPDSAAESNLLMQLGQTSSLRGKYDKACGYFDQVMAHYASIDHASNEDTLQQVEVHLLYSDAMFNLGNYVCDPDCEDAFGRRGAQWHSEQAIKLLDTISGDEGDSNPDNSQFLRKAAQIQFGKIWMNLGNYNEAWKNLEPHFDQLDGIVNENSNNNNNNNDSTGTIGRTFIRSNCIVSKNRIGRIEIGIDESDVKLNVGLCMMRRGRRAEAKEAFRMVSDRAEKDIQLCPWKTLTCDGFILLLSEKPSDAYEKFVESLDKIKNATGSSASPNQDIADNFSYMGLAAYEADMKVESLRYWRRAEQTMLLADDDRKHPLLGSVNSNLGVVLAKRGNINEARRHFREATRQFCHLIHCLDEKNTEELIKIGNNDACLAFAEGQILKALKGFEEAVSYAENLQEKDDHLESRLKENLSKAEIALANQDAEGKVNESPEYFILI